MGCCGGCLLFVGEDVERIVFGLSVEIDTGVGIFDCSSRITAGCSHYYKVNISK